MLPARPRWPPWRVHCIDALENALATVEWVAGFDFPDVRGDYRFVALREPGRYPLESGRVASSDGLDTTPAGFADLVVEEHVARSTALHARLESRLEYLTGPLARYALNSAELPDAGRRVSDAGGSRYHVHQSVPEHHRARGRDRASPATRR